MNGETRTGDAVDATPKTQASQTYPPTTATRVRAAAKKTCVKQNVCARTTRARGNARTARGSVADNGYSAPAELERRLRTKTKLRKASVNKKGRRSQPKQREQIAPPAP